MFYSSILIPSPEPIRKKKLLKKHKKRERHLVAVADYSTSAAFLEQNSKLQDP
jgi:hypothetical protein